MRMTRIRIKTEVRSDKLRMEWISRERIKDEKGRDAGARLRPQPEESTRHATALDRMSDTCGAANPDCVARMVLRKVSLGRPFHISTSALGHATQTRPGPPHPAGGNANSIPDAGPLPRSPGAHFPAASRFHLPACRIKHTPSSRPDGRTLGKCAGVSVPRSPNLLVSLRGGAARNNVVGVVGISPSYKKLS